MAPVKKRPRLEVEKGNHGETSKSPPEEESKLHDDAVAQFLDELDAMESCAPGQFRDVAHKASATLLDLRALQRQLLSTMQRHQDRANEKRREVERQELALQNLLYEKMYLKRQCRDCQDFETPELEKMSRDELPTRQDDVSSTQITNLFLCGSENAAHGDPGRYETIVAQIRSELNQRGTLERNLNDAKIDLSEKKQAFKQKLQFLEDLPKKLRDMEVASLTLQKFFHKKGTPSSSIQLIGTERKKLFELACDKLSGPLYTLFVQLQSYLDAYVEKDLSLEILQHRGKVTTATGGLYTPEATSVLLHLPVPLIKETATANRTLSKPVTIQFDYYPELQMVTARAFGCEDKVDVASLLVSLFPNDNGNILLNASSLMKADDGAALTAETVLKEISGRPYHWCNYIAGLHFLEEQSLERSTKTVVDTILKRLRANATLVHLLSTLEKRKPNPIPVHVALQPSFVGACDAKLVGWTQQPPKAVNKKSFLATIRRKACTLRASVTLDTALYPTVPPAWSLVGTVEESWGEKEGSALSLQDGTNPLYDGTLGQLEDRLGQLDDFVIPGIEETYEWILVHQLRSLVEHWDFMQKAAEDSDPR